MHVRLSLFRGNTPGALRSLCLRHHGPVLRIHVAFHVSILLCRPWNLAVETLWAPPCFCAPCAGSNKRVSKLQGMLDLMAVNVISASASPQGRPILEKTTETGHLLPPRQPDSFSTTLIFIKFILMLSQNLASLALHP